MDQNEQKINRLQKAVDILVKRVESLEKDRVRYEMPDDIRTNIQKAVIGDIKISYNNISLVRDGLIFPMQVCYAGAGIPTFTAIKGTLYVNVTGSSTSTRMYINTNGSTGWTNFTTAT